MCEYVCACVCMHMCHSHMKHLVAQLPVEVLESWTLNHLQVSLLTVGTFPETLPFSSHSRDTIWLGHLIPRASGRWGGGGSRDTKVRLHLPVFCTLAFLISLVRMSVFRKLSHLFNTDVWHLTDAHLKKSCSREHVRLLSWCGVPCAFLHHAPLKAMPSNICSNDSFWVQTIGAGRIVQLANASLANWRNWIPPTEPKKNVRHCSTCL